MNPEMLAQLLAMLAGNPSQGGDLVSQALQGLMGGMIDPRSGAGQAMAQLIDNDIAPLVREQMGLGPLDAYGGFNSVWNPVTAMNKVSNQAMYQKVRRQTNTVISDQNEKMYREMLQRRGVESAGPFDVNRLAIGLGTALSGATQINRAFQESMTTIGYTPGMANEDEIKRNGQIYKDLFNTQQGAKGLGNRITEEYVNNQRAYGNIGGQGMADLIKAMASRGQLQDIGSGDEQKLQGLQEEIKKTARAISGIRDIIKGPVSEVVRQLEATFGSESISIGGKEGLRLAAGKMEQMRQLADMSGLTTGQVAQFARASGMISEQIAGHSADTPAAGITIGAFVGTRQGTDMRGLDVNKYANTMVQRVTGAQQSATGMMISGALATAERQGFSAEEMDTLRARLLKESESGPMTSERIANVTNAVKNGTVTQADVEYGRFSREARDYAKNDSTGTYVAMQQNKTNILLEKNRAMAALGFDTADAGKSLRELGEMTIDKDGKKVPKYTAAALGNLSNIFDAMAQSQGYLTDEQMTTFTQSFEDVQKKEASSKIRAAAAQDFSTISGGLGEFIKDVAKGEVVEDSITKLLGGMTREDRKEFMGRALTNKDTQKYLKGFLGEGEGRTAQEQKAREKIFEEVVQELNQGIDEKGDVITDSDAYIKKETTERWKETKTSGQYLLDKGAVDVTSASSGETGKNKDKTRFGSLTFEHKQEAAIRALQEKLGLDVTSVGDIRGLGEEGREAKLKELSKTAMEKDIASKGEFLGEGALKDIAEAGGEIKKGIPDFLASLQEIMEGIHGLLKLWMPQVGK